jgi:hypothetical protein
MGNTNNKRWHFDTLTPAVVSSDEVRNIQHSNGGYIGRLVQWLQSKGVIGKYKNDETGWDNIAVNRASVKSVVHHDAGAGKVALLEAVPKLIKTGIFLETKQKNEQGLVSHIFAGKAIIDGVQYAVSYVVREDMNGRRYYDHSLTNIEALDRIDSQAPTGTDETATRNSAQTTRPDANPTGKISLSNILKKHLAVNTQTPKNKKTSERNK